MKIRLLIVSGDRDYVEHLSRMLTEQHESIFEVTTCTAAERLTELQANRKFDAALAESDFVAAVPSVGICFQLWSEESNGEGLEKVRRIPKYQRVSQIVSQILEGCAEVSNGGTSEAQARVSVVWSPAGGCGKTTTSLAWAAQQVSKGKKTTYLNLEPFSSEAVYFASDGKSISSVFAKLDGNVNLLLQSIRQEDSGSGVGYFHRPDNYDDIAVLTGEDVLRLIDACAAAADEVVVDMGSVWDEKTSAALERADTVFAVVDSSRASQVKWDQFCQQHNMLERLRKKLVLVANRGAQNSGTEDITVIRLPLVRSDDPVVVYKTLSSGYFRV